jgi:amino acid permease
MVSNLLPLLFAGLALVCCLTAASLPYVTDLMAFVGALLTMTISLILPALMHLRLFKNEAPSWLLVFDVAVVALGVVCAYVGASSAAASLQQKLAGVVLL